MPKPRRRWVGRVVKAVVVVVLVAVGGLAFNSYLDPFDDQPFDQAAWVAAEERERERGPMARVAVRHIPPGTPASRVRGLLGGPDTAQSGSPPDNWGRPVKGYSRWSYGLGCWSGLGPYGFDSAHLEVRFDESGKLVEAEITGG